MTKKLLTLYFLSTLFSANAQNSPAWLTLLKNSKQKFYLKDSIAVQLDKKFTSISTGSLTKVPLDLSRSFFSIDTSECKEGGQYFYSYYFSLDNYANLTFLSQGKFTNYLTLFNNSPSGELLNEIILEGSSVDAGSGDYVKAKRKYYRTFIVTICEPGDYTENCQEKIFVINSNGQISKIKQDSFKRKAE